MIALAVLVLKLLSCKVLFINRKAIETATFFKKIAIFTGKLLQNYKQLQCKFQDSFQNVSDHLSVLFQFA